MSVYPKFLTSSVGEVRARILGIAWRWMVTFTLRPLYPRTEFVDVWAPRVKQTRWGATTYLTWWEMNSGSWIIHLIVHSPVSLLFAVTATHIMVLSPYQTTHSLIWRRKIRRRGVTRLKRWEHYRFVISSGWNYCEILPSTYRVVCQLRDTNLVQHQV